MPLGLTLLEKFFGLLTILIGALVFNYTRQIKLQAGIGYNFFFFFGLVLIVLGIFIIFAKSSVGMEE